MMPFFEMFLKLVIGHAFADFVFQNDFMGRNKNRHLSKTAGSPGWVYVLSGHALIHGSMVWLFTGSIWLCLAETAAHWIIDFGKCEGWYEANHDQAMHIACKALWTVVA